MSLRGAHQIKPEAISRLRTKRRRNPALDRQDEQMAHDCQIITPTILHKVALGSDSCQTLTNLPPAGSCDIVTTCAA
jgi:hypothetical protein